MVQLPAVGNTASPRRAAPEGQRAEAEEERDEGKEEEVEDDEESSGSGWMRQMSQDDLVEGVRSMSLGKGDEQNFLQDLAEIVQQKVDEKVEAELGPKNETIRQLKQVVRGQHQKLQELVKGSRQGSSTKEPQIHLQSMQDCEELRLAEAQVRRLKNQLSELHKRNADLKRLTRRYSAMLSQTSMPEEPRGIRCCVSSVGSASTPFSPSGEHSFPATQEAAPSQPSGGLLQVPPSPGPASPALRGSSPGPSRQSSNSPRSPRFNAGGSARFRIASRALMALWREESERGILGALLHGACQLTQQAEGDGRATTVMLYLSDPWLRSAVASSGEDRGTNGRSRMDSPTVFYLKGKVCLHGYGVAGHRTEPPRFPDLSSLPLQRAGQVLALPLQAGHEPILGALQVSAGGHQTPADGHFKVLADGDSSATPLSLSDSQVHGLQLLISMASGIIAQRCRLQASKALYVRSRECLALTTEVQGAHTIMEFEQSVKVCMTRFFHVTIVRVSFYDPQTQKLLTTSAPVRLRKGGRTPGQLENKNAMVGRRTISRFPLEGCVGRCVRYRQVIHVESVAKFPHISEHADGLDLSDTHDVNMLCGPMVAKAADDSWQVVGVLQLIEKKRRSDSDAHVDGAAGEAPSPGLARRGVCEEFTEEDQDFFGSLLRPLGQAAQRTMRAQLYGEPASGSAESAAMNIERLLSG